MSVVGSICSGLPTITNRCEEKATITPNCEVDNNEIKSGENRVLEDRPKRKTAIEGQELRRLREKYYCLINNRRECVETSETLRRRIFFVLVFCFVEKGGALMLTDSDLILLL